MNNIAIKVENLTKEYKISHEVKDPYKKLSDVMVYLFKNIFTPWKLFNRTETEVFKALDDVSFEIKKGEKIAIIGRNGAGKSTLLKILSRITEPTDGSVKINGRVASLLEVGTGFHPELTGRENIYLNGSILGMTREEIDKKFNEIVEFSGCEKFLDTPIKRYSSGMKVRLGFAVAAHLDSEILIVDEVLAVGDAEFQKKCLGKMNEISMKGERTIIFVSHNMEAAKELCNQTILVEQGSLKFLGETVIAIEKYNKNLNKMGFQINKSLEQLEFLGLEIEEREKSRYDLKLNFNSIGNIKDVAFSFMVYSDSLKSILHYSGINVRKYFDINIGKFEVTLNIFDLFLNSGEYKLAIHFETKDGNILLNIDNIPFIKQRSNNAFILHKSLLDLKIDFNINSK
ncbi:ABC transporter ATP-binding protein [Propionigenium maris DSM 9537]|uniref:ABC transporter ATP-binding protein n=1 Tax=Propionigenium maris DSM 9537 TaxID=1123000 RepID=A0A9W6LNN4_9FUSO|nr:ABC transporter ATP-binding protein [Propionigenium maris]GLI56793.1 ABC transporter ATP-binding protein [Propionigenium maris DSM 9537]